jgi:hypothetical protein
MIFFIIAFLIVGAHLLLLDIPLDILLLEFIDNLLSLQPLLMLRDLLRFDNMIDELHFSMSTFRMISLITGYT